MVKADPDDGPDNEQFYDCDTELDNELDYLSDLEKEIDPDEELLELFIELQEYCQEQALPIFNRYNAYVKFLEFFSL